MVNSLRSRLVLVRTCPVWPLFYFKFWNTVPFIVGCGASLLCYKDSFQKEPLTALLVSNSDHSKLICVPCLGCYPLASFPFFLVKGCQQILCPRKNIFAFFLCRYPLSLYRGRTVLVATVPVTAMQTATTAITAILCPFTQMVPRTAAPVTPPQLCYWACTPQRLAVSSLLTPRPLDFWALGQCFLNIPLLVVLESETLGNEIIASKGLGKFSYWMDLACTAGEVYWLHTVDAWSLQLRTS